MLQKLVTWIMSISYLLTDREFRSLIKAAGHAITAELGVDYIEWAQRNLPSGEREPLKDRLWKEQFTKLIYQACLPVMVERDLLQNLHLGKEQFHKTVASWASELGETHAVHDMWQMLNHDIDAEYARAQACTPVEDNHVID